MASDHRDTVSENTFISKCTVHTIEEYQALSETNDLTDFFWRIEYKPHTREFKPDRVEVYCVCELPYNPDRFMAECSTCKECEVASRYHPECLGITKEPMASPNWRCIYCVNRTATLPRVSHNFVPTRPGFAEQEIEADYAVGQKRKGPAVVGGDPAKYRG